MDPLSLFESDEITTREGPLKIFFLGHASLIFFFRDLKVYIDPYSDVADFSSLPKANIILITHEHGDHFDRPAIEKIINNQTQIVLNENSAEKMGSGNVLHNGDEIILNGLKIQAVPAYNRVHKRANGQFYHPQGTGNGYVITFGDKKVYAAGDTENIPEMKDLQNIDCAFLPMNLPYTMTPQMVAEAASDFRPKILYPYHYGETEMEPLITLMKKVKGVELRIKRL